MMFSIVQTGKKAHLHRHLSESTTRVSRCKLTSSCVMSISNVAISDDKLNVFKSEAIQDYKLRKLMAREKKAETAYRSEDEKSLSKHPTAQSNRNAMAPVQQEQPSGTSIRQDQAGSVNRVNGQAPILHSNGVTNRQTQHKSRLGVFPL
ncbi:hypothetical protein PoB_002525500 [Plakobranchus ocellatus]|uniref:Uncharacterized protein n=1 Tax=Plakobranchus ocellatus TaxID=259542 RepID=A0AAV3ZSH1_9GAST|nr:hypothetical protein PoB_002525500 [Plakobranchus ocellatus]